MSCEVTQGGQTLGVRLAPLVSPGGWRVVVDCNNWPVLAEWADSSDEEHADARFGDERMMHGRNGDLIELRVSWRQTDQAPPRDHSGTPVTDPDARTTNHLIELHAAGLNLYRHFVLPKHDITKYADAYRRMTEILRKVTAADVTELIETANEVYARCGVPETTSHIEMEIFGRAWNRLGLILRKIAPSRPRPTITIRRDQEANCWTAQHSEGWQDKRDDFPKATTGSIFDPMPLPFTVEASHGEVVLALAAQYPHCEIIVPPTPTDEVTQ